MEKNTVGMIVAAFVILIVGIAGFVGTVATEGQALTEKTRIVNETLNIATTRSGDDGGNDPSVNLAIAQSARASSECDIDEFSMINQTWDRAVANTDFIFNEDNGTVNILNTTKWFCFYPVDTGICNRTNDNITLISYRYCDADYLREAWQRTVLDLVPGFMSIALMLVAVGLFYQIAKREGILNI